MENKLNKTKETLAQRLDLPRDVVMNIPRITITGDNEITIENHKGVILFEEKEIKVNSNVGLITVYGYGFEILFMGGTTLTLSGKFKSVVYEGNE
ncbi:sporulation protein YqfC [Clostridium sp. SYSU_GA19001]|uniref:sporulation protein YqfC n=1 Tax=Clostridium caldaquaticum TaxID=2940653 RepID=UPI0020775236|nr:sporulation protein YqfC [Clostridium caldaquaticum]